MVWFWQLLKVNFARRWRLILVVSVAIGLTVLVTTCINRGTKIDALNGIVADLKSLVTRKDDTLSVVRGQVVGLQRDTIRLGGQLVKEKNKRLEAEAQIDAGERQALLTDQAIDEGKRKVRYLTGQLSAYQLKEAADAGLRANNLGMPGGQPLLVTDTAVTRRFAILTAYGRVYHDSTQALKKTVGQQRVKIEQQAEVITSQGERISEIEAIERGLIYTVNKVVDESQAERHPLGFGQRKSKERLRRKLVDHLTPKPLTK